MKVSELDPHGLPVGTIVMQRHVITGAAGFVGANLAKRLLSAGAAVVAIDDLSRGTVDNLAELDGHAAFEFHRLDCSDASSMTEEFGRFGPVTDVWHLAANS